MCVLWVYVCAREFNITHLHKWGYNNNAKERLYNYVFLYCLFRINLTLYMYRVMCINEFDINVLTRNYAVVLQISPTQIAVQEQIRKLSVRNIYNKQMLSIVRYRIK